MRYLETMEVHLSPEQQERLEQIAMEAGTEPARLVASFVGQYLEEDAHFLTAIEKGLAAAERGEFIEEGEMDARVAAMFPR